MEETFSCVHEHIKGRLGCALEEVERALREIGKHPGLVRYLELACASESEAFAASRGLSGTIVRAFSRASRAAREGVLPGGARAAVAMAESLSL